MSKTLVQHKIAYLKKVVDILESIDAQPENTGALCEALKYHASDICSDVIYALQRDGMPAMQELKDTSSRTYYWSARLGMYLDPLTGESLTETTGAILPFFSGTIDRWNEGFINMANSVLRDLEPHRNSSATIFTNSHTNKWVTNVLCDFSSMFKFMIDEEVKDSTMFVVSSNGKCSTIVIKDLV